MLKTKKYVLSKIYNDFHIEINKVEHFENIFPNLKDIDIKDILFIVNHHFGMTNDYKKVIIDLLSINSIVLNSDTFEKVLIIITKFLTIFKSI